ncbi:MAG: TetR/AcrR family transcriptional regulator [Candidatus Aminicenantes bacterium]|nr:TetR/AcrR family transcriptional regulator [Candidatus Aminicenantes bacterium]
MCAKVVDKKEKKDGIVTAAISEFAKKGFAKTTINDIAAAAGIGKGTVYEYFENKEAIINYSFGYFMRSLELDMEEILISKVPAREKLRQIFDLFSDMNNWSSVEFIELWFDFWSEGIRSKSSKGVLLKDMNLFYRSYRELFAAIIVEGMNNGSFRKNINPENAAAMIIGALDGIMVQWVLDKENFDFSGVVQTIKFTVLRGLSAAPAQGNSEANDE